MPKRPKATLRPGEKIVTSDELHQDLAKIQTRAFREELLRALDHRGDFSKGEKDRIRAFIEEEMK